MKFAIILAALVASSALAGSRVATAPDGDFMRLHDVACSHAGTLAHIQPQHRPQFKKAMLRMNGAQVYGCWIDMGGAILIVLEDGRAAPFDPSIFHEEPGA